MASREDLVQGANAIYSASNSVSNINRYSNNNKDDNNDNEDYNEDYNEENVAEYHYSQDEDNPPNEYEQGDLFISLLILYCW